MAKLVVTIEHDEDLTPEEMLELAASVQQTLQEVSDCTGFADEEASWADKLRLKVTVVPQ